MVFESMKNVSPLKEKVISHWRIILCLIVVISSYYFSIIFFKEIDSHLISLGAFIVYSLVVYKFFGGYTQHYKND
jgi:hypothetical protein